MANEWTCGGCGNVNTRKECVKCGTEQPNAVGTRDKPPELARLRCRYDGETLETDGFCLAGNGYPDYLKCPIACPFCRQPLEWSGACFGCHGSAAHGEKETWTVPGHRYETHDDQGHRIGDGQHWVSQVQGPRPACSPQQNAAEAKMLARVLSGIGTQPIVEKPRKLTPKEDAVRLTRLTGEEVPF